MTPRLRFALLAMVAGMVAIALRVPQLAGPHLIADGDEAVLGLMAKHMAEGGEASFFFMGQRFGIAFLEAGAAAAMMKLLGPTTLALKLGVFVLWLLGALFLTLAARQLGGDTAGVVAAFLIAFCPAWGAFALKARGYYAASFMLCHLGVWMSARLASTEAGGRSRGSIAVELGALGAVAATLLLSQPIWFVGLLPFVFWMLHGRNRKSDLAPMLAGAGVIAVAAAVALWRQPPAHWAPPAFNNSEGFAALLDLPRRFAGSMGGAFYMREAAGGIFPWVGAMWALALPLAAIRPLGRERGIRPLRAGLLALISIAGVLGFSLANQFNYRYLIPAADFLVILLALELGRALRTGGAARWAAAAGAVALVLAGGVATIQMRSLVLAWTVEPRVASERAALDELLAELEGRGIGHVYCMNPVLQWTLTFTSGERVLARWHAPDDRDPAIPRAVDRALFDGGPVGLVGYVDQLEEMQRTQGRVGARVGEGGGEAVVVGDRYALLASPGPELLERLGFRLNRAPEAAR